MAVIEQGREMMAIDSNNTNGGSVMCQLTDPEGKPLGASLYLPQTAGPSQLQQLVNNLLANVSICGQNSFDFPLFIQFLLKPNRIIVIFFFHESSIAYQYAPQIMLIVKWSPQIRSLFG